MVDVAAHDADPTYQAGANATKQSSDLGGQDAQPPPPVGVQVTFVMKAFDTVAVEFFTWSVTGSPDYGGLSSGRNPNDLTQTKVFVQF